jgi:hypothetical protein
MAEKLSNVEVIHLIQELKRMEKAGDPKSWREGIFRQIPKEFKIKICLGCGEDYDDCDCPAGSAENLRNEDEIAKLLQLRTLR